MTGQLQVAGGGGDLARCVHCGVEAVGPCARCHVPLCGECCVIEDVGAKPWAICRDCDATGTGEDVRSGWWSVALWVGGPIVILALAVLLLAWLTG